MDQATRYDPRTFTCADCGKVDDALSEFPKSRCLDCHAAAPEVVRELATMTAGDLARMWGAK